MDLMFIRNHRFTEKQANDYSKLLDEMAYEYCKKIIQKNKGDAKIMKKNRCINVNIGDLVFWYNRKNRRVAWGKVVEISFCKGKGCIIIDNDNHLDYKSILFAIPQGFYKFRDRLNKENIFLNFEDSISYILQQQFEKKEEAKKEPEIKLYSFQEKIYNEIINHNSDSATRQGRKYLFIEMPPRTGKTTLIKKLNEYFNYRYRMNLSYNTLFKHLGVYDNKEKSSIALIDDMQKTLVDTTEEINRSVLQTADCIKKYTTDNALIVFIGGRFGINDYTSVMRSHIVNQVANGNPFSLLVKKYPAWENSASQCSPMLDYKPLKGIKEQMGEEMFSVMYLLKV